MALVLVSDTLYNAEGQLANGYIALTWPTFTASDSHVVQGSATPLIIPIANGVLSVSLESCAGTTPSGVTYTANYNLGTPSSTPEFWNVPASGPVNLATIRTNPQPPVTYSTLPTSSLTGVITVAQGGTGQITLFSSGTAIFAGAGGAYSGDNSYFFWDDTNHRLGIGTNTPANTLSVNGGNLGVTSQGANNSAIIVDNHSGGNQSNLELSDAGTVKWIIGKDASNNFFLFDSANSRDSLQVVSGNVILSPAGGDTLVGGSSDGGFKLDVQKSGSSGTVRIFDQTAVTGVTSVGIQAGAGQSTTPLVFFENNGGATVASVGEDGSFATWDGSNHVKVYTQDVTIGLSSDSTIQWKNITNWIGGGSIDIGVSRVSAGVLGVGNGVQGDVSGTVDARNANIGATSGAGTSTLTVTAGASQSTTSLVVAQTNGGANLATIGSDGSFGVWNSGTSRTAVVSNNTIGLGANAQVAWRNNAAWDSGAVDSGISRIGAATLGVGNGTLGDVSGTIVAAGFKFGTNTTGAGSASLGSNCPAVTAGHPYTWLQVTSSDGSTVYIPAFK